MKIAFINLEIIIIVLKKANLIISNKLDFPKLYFLLFKVFKSNFRFKFRELKIRNPYLFYNLLKFQFCIFYSLISCYNM